MSAPELLWSPSDDDIRGSQMTAFALSLRRLGLEFEPGDYQRLHDWSIQQPEQFWDALAGFLGVEFHAAPEVVLRAESVEEAVWFPGATLNYAEHLLRPIDGMSEDAPAIIATREDGQVSSVSRAELRALVARARTGLMAVGVGKGDVVAAMVPNGIEALVAMLAAASLGAIWTSCSPEFGPKAVIDRLVQLRPSVLVAVSGYQYGGRVFDICDGLVEIIHALPGTVNCVLVSGPHGCGQVPGSISWDELLASPGVLAFEPVPFEHPLWTLFTSGTTGAPKGIVHSHGGIALEHGKVWRLHHDVTAASRLFWFTTTGWMLWNLVASGLATGACIVTYDGNPSHPHPGRLWDLVGQHGITHFGLSAPYVMSCMKAEVQPLSAADAASLEMVISTGSPLPEAGFSWLQSMAGRRAKVASISGGTDVCTAFIGTSPWRPLWNGEVSCALLGAQVLALDDGGDHVINQVGELVLAAPMPSMPVAFWADQDGQRLHDAYFADIPGVWRHGDWVRVTERGSFVIYGRSDSTLNRAGVRMGTSEFYAVVEEFDEVMESLVIDTSGLDDSGQGQLLCFLVLAPGIDLSDVEPRLRQSLREHLSPRHVPDRFFVVLAVPRTLNGKKCEVPVRRILRGEDPQRVVNPASMINPSSLDFFIELGRQRCDEAGG